MPHLTQSFGIDGPVIRFYVGVSTPRREALIKEGGTFPEPVAVIGLIDTGACGTCIDPAVLAPLELQPTGVVSIHTPSTGGSAVQVLQYDVDIFLVANPGQNSVRSFSTVPIIEAPLVGQGIQALIGRDILKDCLLIYDGQASSFTLGI